MATRTFGFRIPDSKVRPHYYTLKCWPKSGRISSLSPICDQHLFSLYSINIHSNIQVTGIREMITKHNCIDGWTTSPTYYYKQHLENMEENLSVDFGDKRLKQHSRQGLIISGRVNNNYILISELNLMKVHRTWSFLQAYKFTTGNKFCSLIVFMEILL